MRLKKGGNKMDKCPKCGGWTLEYSHERGGVVRCYNWPDCNYEKPKDWDEWCSEHNDLPKLVEALKLRG